MPPKPRKLRRGLWWSDATRTWHYEFRLDGQKHSGNTGHALNKSALDWVALKKQSIKNLEVGIQTRGAALTLADLVALYCEKRGGNSGEGAVTPHTIDVIQLRLRLHWQPLAGTPIDAISNAQVEDLRKAYLEGTGRRSKAGANKILAQLRTVLGWAVQRGLLDAVPFKVARLKPQKKVQAVVWPEQLRPFLRASRACRNADARLAMMACLTMGFREAEVLGLRWEWFDWTAQVYRVGKAKDADVRAIPMHPLFRRVLRTRWHAQGQPTRGLVLKAADGEAHRAGYLRKPVDTAARYPWHRGPTPAPPARQLRHRLLGGRRQHRPAAGLARPRRSQHHTALHRPARPRWPPGAGPLRREGRMDTA